MQEKIMRLPILLGMLAAALHVQAIAAPLVPAVKLLQVQARPDVADLACEPRVRTSASKRAPDTDPYEVPTEETVRAMAEGADLAQPATPAAGAPVPAAGAYRIAIWGDSHLAAGFFTDELARQLKIPSDNVSNVLLPATMGRAGVRLPIRRSCVSPQWKYEPGYLGGDGARLPGPGLVNMVSQQSGATIAWDVRSDKRVARYERVRILYQQTDSPLVVAVSVDGAPETQVTLDGAAGPALLELAADQPISQVALRVVDGTARLHGLDLQARRAGSIVMDVFGYPGATVAAWKAAQPDYLASWFGQRDYQLVLLEFGTNEGAAKPFDLQGYRRTLEDSVRTMRAVFPNAACVLIAPGDRGVLVRQSANGKTSTARRSKGKAKPAPRIDLFVYSRIHAAIGQAQREVAAAAGCGAWSMMDAMGGPGQSYAWARQSPPLMARDLIHFTVAGYQRFAQKFARDMGWTTPEQQGADVK